MKDGAVGRVLCGRGESDATVLGLAKAAGEEMGGRWYASKAASMRNKYEKVGLVYRGTT